MGALLSKLAKGPLYATPGYKPPVYKAPKSTFTSEFGRAYNAVNRPSLRLPARIAGSVGVTTPVTPAALPQRFNIKVPYSSQPPTPVGVLPLPAVPGGSPSGQQDTRGDLLGSLGAAWGDVISGQEINLGNVTMFLAERPFVLGSAFGGLVTEALADALGMSKVGDQMKDVWAAAGDQVAGVARSAAGVAAAVLDGAGNSFRDSYLINRADFARSLAEPSLSVDQVVGTVSGPDGFRLTTQVRQLRLQGMSEQAIRAVLYDAVDLPGDVKQSIVGDPKVSVFDALEKAGQARQFAYGDDLGAQAANFIGPMAGLGLDFLAGKAAFTGTRLLVGGVAAGGGAAAGAAARVLSVGTAAAGQARIGMRAGGALIAAGTGIYATTKVIEAVEKYAGAEAAYEFTNRTLWTRPLSDDPATCFVGSLMFTGLEGLSFLRKVIPQGARVATSAAIVAARAPIVAGARVVGRKIPLVRGALTTWEDVVMDRLAYMYDPNDLARGRAFVEKYYVRPITDAAGHPIAGPLDRGMMSDEVVQTAIDLVMERLPPEGIAKYAVMKHGIDRTELFVKDHVDEIGRLIREDPKALARRWRNESWNHRMADTGVPFDGDAAGLIAIEYHRVKRLTYELRTGLDAVPGMVEHVTPDVTKAVRDELAAKFAEATSFIPNAYVADKLARLPGLRQAMREVRSEVREAEGRILGDGTWTRADFEKALDRTDDRYWTARGLGKRDVASAVKYLPADAPISRIADVVGLDVPTVKVILTDAAKPVTARQLSRVMDYLYAVAGKSRDDISRMSAEEVRRAAAESLDDTLSPLYAAGERVAKVNEMARRLQGELADARAVGNADLAAAKQGELERLLALSDYALDPAGTTAAREAVGAQREARIGEILDGYGTRAEAQARAREIIDELEDVESELRALNRESGRSLAEAFDDYGRYVGFDAPRLSAGNLARIEHDLGIALADDMDQPMVMRLASQLLRRGATPQDMRKLRSIIGPAATTQVRSYMARKASTLTDLADAAGMSYDDFLHRVTYLLDRRQALLGGDFATIAGARQAADMNVDLPVRVARLFERRLEATGVPDFDAATGANVPRLDPLVEADLSAFRNPNVSAAEKAAIMRRWGFDPNRDYDLAVMGTSEAWAVDDPLWRVDVHPRNVRDLEQIAKEWTATPDEQAVIRLQSLLDSDHTLASAAAALLRRSGRLERPIIEVHVGEGLMYPQPGPITWSHLTKEDMNEILTAETGPNMARPIAGELDSFIDAGDEAALTKAATQRAKRREPTPPATNVPEDMANRARSAPRPTRKSYVYGRELVRRGGKVTMRVDESIMADPKYARGAATLGTILWATPKARPHTIESVLEALRDIENGVAREYGIGDSLLAEAQKTADALLSSAMRRIDSAGFAPGTFTRGIRYDDLSLADRELWSRMTEEGFTITDPTAGLMYGLKKRPQAKWKVAKGAPEGTPPTLVRPGAAVMELEAVRAAAAEQHVPGIVEELLAGRFMTYEERVANGQVRNAFNLVFGVHPKSAYNTSPWEYVFGKIANRDIGAFVRDEFRTRAVALGLTNEEVDAIWQAWHDFSRTSTEGTTKGRRMFSRSTKPFEVRPGDRPRYATIANIPNDSLDKVARQALTDYHASQQTRLPGYAKMAPGPGDTSVPFAFLLREAASPVMRHLQDGLVMYHSLPVVGGKRLRFGSFGQHLEQLYGQSFNKWRTTIYPVFRFAMDVRFAAMEFIEPYALGAGRGAMRDARYTGRGLMDMNETYLAHGTAESRMAEHLSTWGQSRRFEQAYSLFEKERTPAVEAELAAIRRESPEVYAAARKEALSQRSGLMIEDPVDFEAALRMMAEDDPALSDAIAAFDKGDTGAWLDELDRWHRKLVSFTDPAEAVADEIDRIIAASPHLNEIATRIGEVNRRYWEDVRQLFWGKADRSRAERVLNHPLLFWPISYQIRATEWLANVLFRRAGGLPTNALGAYELDRLMAAHNEAMEKDPEYRAWLERHRNILFAASMLLPITPDQIGVSLAPWTRLAGDAVGAWDYDRSTSAFAIGPIYTVTQLAPNVTGELWADLRSWDELRDAPGVSQVVKAGTKMVGLPYGRDVEWDAEEPPPPPPWVATGP